MAHEPTESAIPPQPPADPARVASQAPPVAATPAERIRRLTGAAARAAAGEKIGGRPKGVVEAGPRKRRQNLPEPAYAPGVKPSRLARALTKPQAIFAALWVSGQHQPHEALEAAYQQCGIEPLNAGRMKVKAERWLRSPDVRAECERVAQVSGIPSSILAARARRELWNLLGASDEHVRHQAVMTALKLNGDLRPTKGGGNGLDGGRGEGPAIGTVVLNQLNLGDKVTPEQLAAALQNALERGVKANESAHHRHAEGALLPPG